MTRVPGMGHAQIKFDGLMIGRYDRDRRIYQLGVLPAEGHKFSICYQINGPRRDGATVLTLPDEKERGVWRLGIANREPDTELYFSETEPDRHNPPNDPTSNEAMDFGWVLDLEGDEFPEHPKPMPLIPGRLKPVFHIRNGVIYNTNLTEPLKRTLDGKEEEVFGRVSNSIGVDLDVRRGEEIFLKNVKTDEDLFRIRVELNELVRIFINNIPPEGVAHIHGLSDNTFHFRMYYDTFKVDEKERYDFTVPSENAPEPAHHAIPASPAATPPAPAGSGPELTHHDSGHEHPGDQPGPSHQPSDDPRPSCSGGRGIPGMLCGTTHLSKFSKSLG
jgi:hypothetical protein